MFISLNNHQIIQLMSKLLKIFLLNFVFFLTINANKTDFYKLGIVEFNKNNLKAAKILFEKDIVRNPKNKDSYIFLAKIYKKQKNHDEFEKNLNTALLLDPKSEEALYLLIILKTKDGDFDFADKKIKIFDAVCKNMCAKSKELKKILKKTTG
jgi:tetratricopeptide (TPR) repeat protein